MFAWDTQKADPKGTSCVSSALQSCKLGQSNSNMPLCRISIKDSSNVITFVTSYSCLGASPSLGQVGAEVQDIDSQLLTEVGFVLYRNGVIKLNIYFQEYNYRTISESAATTVSAHPSPSGRAGTGQPAGTGRAQCPGGHCRIPQGCCLAPAVMKWMKPPLPGGSQPSIPFPLLSLLQPHRGALAKEETQQAGPRCIPHISTGTRVMDWGGGTSEGSPFLNSLHSPPTDRLVAVQPGRPVWVLDGRVGAVPH